MSQVIYLRVHGNAFKRAEIENGVEMFVSEPHWIDSHTLKAELGEFSRVQFKLMFSSLQHDLGIILSAVSGFDDDVIMSAFLDLLVDNRPGKSIGAAETLILSKLLGNSALIQRLDHHFESIGRDVMDTARMYLDTGRSVNASAAHLYLHRNTFRYRLNKFITQTKLDIREIEQGKLLEMWFLLTNLE